MPLQITNQAAAFLNAGIASGATSMAVQAGQGALFPVLGAEDWFYATLINGSGFEIVKVTARASDTMTIVRAQEGTTAKTFNAGDPVELRITAQTFLEYISVPDRRKFSVDTSLSLVDIGHTLIHPSADVTARTVTIPANAAVPFPPGTTIQIRNENGAGALTIAITTDTLRMVGTGATGSRTVAANGFVTLYKDESTEWCITGTGLT
jgi:hypothetical protein